MDGWMGIKGGIELSSQIVLTSICIVQVLISKLEKSGNSISTEERSVILKVRNWNNCTFSYV